MLFEFFWKCFNEQILAYICNMTDLLPHVDLYIITCVIAFVTFETAATEIYTFIIDTPQVWQITLQQGDTMF